MGSIEVSNGDYQIGSLAGKVALVTGSGRGIGRGIALGLAQRGASVVVNYANTSKGAEELVRQIEQLGSKAFAIKADVTKVAEVERLFKEAIDQVRTSDPSWNLAFSTQSHIFEQSNSADLLLVRTLGYCHVKQRDRELQSCRQDY